MPLSLSERNGSVEIGDDNKKRPAVLPACPSVSVADGAQRAQIMHQLHSIQRALIGFEGIYTALSSQMLHALGMTSF